MSCSAPGECLAGGGSTYSTDGAFLVRETDGTWASAQPVAGLASLPGSTGSVVRDVSCPVAYGDEQAENVSVTVMADSGTRPGSVVVKAGSATLCTVTLIGGQGGCAVPARRFTPGKVVLNTVYAGAPGFTASLPATATFTVGRDVTVTALHLSTSTVTLGHESVERLTVVVTPNFVRPAAGQVTVTAGTHAVCVISLSSGTGSCTLRTWQLAAGMYTMTARYAGTSLYAPSKSGNHTLTVRR